jgi:hypothetical protein
VENLPMIGGEENTKGDSHKQKWTEVYIKMEYKEKKRSMESIRSELYTSDGSMTNRLNISVRNHPYTLPARLKRKRKKNKREKRKRKSSGSQK